MNDIRNRLMNTILICVSILGAPIMFFIFFRYLSVGGLLILLSPFIAYLACITALVLRRYIPLKFKVLIINCCALVVALTSIFKWGLVGMGVPFLIFCSILITVFWGVRSGIMVTVVNLMIIFIAAILFHMKVLHIDLSLNEYALAFPSWVTAGSEYGIFTAVLVFILGRLYHSMASTIEKLKTRTFELQHAKEHLENEIQSRKQAETSLQESEERFRVVLENMPGSVFVHDLVGRNLIVNDEACRVMGYTREELLAKTVEETERKAFDMENARKIWRELVETGESITFESVDRRNDGLQHNLETHLKTIILQGEPVILAIAFDITERKKAENALRESEERFRTVLENLPGCVSVHDLEGRHLMVNEKMCIDNGYTREELLDMTVMDTSGPGFDCDAARRLWHEIEPGTSFTLDTATRRKDGSVYESEVHLTSIIFEGQAVILALVFDITERKKSEEALKKSETYLRTLVSTIPDLICLKDLDGKFLYCNSRFEELFGVKESDIMGKTDYDFIPKEFVDSIREKDQAIITQGSSSINEEEVLFANDGHREILETIRTPMYSSDGDLVGVLAIGRDITERKKFEESIARHSELERLISETSSRFVGMSHYEASTHINEALASIGKKTGVDHAYMFLINPGGDVIDDMNEWCIDDTVPKIGSLKDVDPERDLPWFNAKLNSQEVIYIPDIEQLPPDAKKEKIYFSAQRIKSLVVLVMRHGENIMGFLGFDNVYRKRTWSEDEIVILRIIGEAFTSAIQRKQAEREQEKLQAQLTTAVELAHLGPWELNIKNRLFSFNDQFYKIYHTNAEDMGGYTMSHEEYVRRFVHPDDMSFVRKNERNDFKGDNTLPGRIEHKMMYADGTTGYVMSQMFLVKDGKGIPVKAYGVNQDITEWKIAQEKLRESEEKLARSRKMESLGLLAGGVAHDLNNVLSGIVSYPELLLMDLPEDSKMRKSIETIKKSGERAVAIVQDLLTIARGAVTIKEPLNMNDIIHEYLSSPEFVKLKGYHPTVEINKDLYTGLFNIKGSLIHIKKVLMNLVSNASEAIESKGKVTISTKNIYLDKPISRYEDVKPGEYIVLSVSDNGPGIAPKNLERIFEPFFTKKVMGVSGTGLGLAVVWNIVQDHSGYIDVRSNESGTKFDLYFPITRDDILDRKASVMLEDIKGRGESILVVDDVESQREISCRMLDILGYDYASVASGEEAVAYLEEKSVDLILLDMIMEPGISGRETYERIVKIHPGQKAVIASGFTKTEDVVAIQKLGAGRYIKKPFTLTKLGSAIKDELM